MAMEPNATRFPFPLPPRTIGEQKAKVKAFSNRSDEPVSGDPADQSVFEALRNGGEMGGGFRDADHPRMVQRHPENLKREFFTGAPELLRVPQLHLVAPVWLKAAAPVHADHLHVELFAVHTDDDKVIRVLSALDAGLNQMLE